MQLSDSKIGTIIYVCKRIKKGMFGLFSMQAGLPE